MIRANTSLKKERHFGKGITIGLLTIGLVFGGTLSYHLIAKDSNVVKEQGMVCVQRVQMGRELYEITYDGYTKTFTKDNEVQQKLYVNGVIYPILEPQECDEEVDLSELPHLYGVTYECDLDKFNGLYSKYLHNGWRSTGQCLTNNYMDIILFNGGEVIRLFYANGKAKVLNLTEIEPVFTAWKTELNLV